MAAASAARAAVVIAVFKIFFPEGDSALKVEIGGFDGGRAALLLLLLRPLPLLVVLDLWGPAVTVTGPAAWVMCGRELVVVLIGAGFGGRRAWSEA